MKALIQWIKEKRSAVKKMGIFFTALSITACSISPQLAVSEAINHGGQTYYLASQQDLGTIARYVYVPKGETAEQWHSAIELLQDRNKDKLSLADRIALRKRVYRNTGVQHFDIYTRKNELFAFVIYDPSAQNPDWQVNVARGKNIPFCGFVQYQYSVKIAKDRKLMNMAHRRVIRYLKKYIVDKEMQKLNRTPFAWSCNS
ncbi:hypothetical protein L5B97_07760 [Avibacterium sp. 20-15]|nr:MULTISPECIES: hypothetical protein [unclassified Avibacterium]MCW9717079.1 hypothetical protein [Avibacterium sp. 21-599]MCW9733363.1 hypothetical protein [Avibacterium sp. 20-15]URL01643.1 hypothetical protein L4F91_08985 [Avibacterium sp. 20-126]URL03237.1 hypothetical protein L4F93_06450 [Avibacterium sp. 20-132]